MTRWSRLQRVEDVFGEYHHDPARPRLQLHEAIEADLLTWETVRELLQACRTAGTRGLPFPTISGADLTRYREAMAGIREFDAWDSVSVARLDARDELLAFLLGHTPWPSSHREAVARLKDLTRRAFTVRPAWESPHLEDPELTKELMQRVRSGG